MGRLPKDSGKEEKMVKVKRVLGQKLDRFMDCKFYQENPDIRLKLLGYEEVELLESIFINLKGLKIVEDKKVEE